MKQMHRLSLFLQKPFFSDYRTLFGLWLLLPIIAGLIKVSNNFLIFKYVFWHTVDQTSLYTAYPEYWDTNHYGPVFSLVIAPFAILPPRLGLILWLVVLSLALYYAVRKLPLVKRKHIFIY
ncbi:glycosyltransferase family 87 protein, partial [Bacteroides sp.]|uniref:glycosyltransferase family 87 protein n=1 Tax=Bacteroides sp. TaxID=29523 RepID=UPI002FC722EA